MRSSWCDALELVKISTPSRPIAMCGELGVNSSSHSSMPMTVSFVATTASPKGTYVWV